MCKSCPGKICCVPARPSDMLGKKNTRSAAHGRRSTQLNIPSPSLSAIDDSDEDSSEGGMEEASDDGDNAPDSDAASSSSNDSDVNTSRKRKAPASKARGRGKSKAKPPAKPKKRKTATTAKEYKPAQYFIDRVGHDIMMQPGATRVDEPPEECMIRSEPEGGWEGIYREVSITVSLQKRNIQGDQVLERMENFFKFRCIKGIGSTEKGFNEDHLHFQGVACLVATSSRAVAEEIKKALGWTKGHTPAGMNVMCKGLDGKGLHTLSGMIGYCTKDEGSPHFRLISHNISQEEIEDGKMEYIKYGKGDIKGKVTLDMRNLMCRANLFYQKKMPHSQPRNEIPLLQVLTTMMKTGVYYPTAAWVVPNAGRGMPMWRANSLWKCMVNPEHVDETDIANVFFEHDSEEPVEKESWNRYFTGKKLRDSTQRIVTRRKEHPLPSHQQHLGNIRGQDFVPFSRDSDSEMDEREERVRDWAPVGNDLWVLDGTSARVQPVGPDDTPCALCPGLLF